MKYYHRYLLGRLSDGTSSGKIRIILGARQTGKSTLQKMMMGDNAFYVNLQERRTRRQYERNPDRLGKELQVVAPTVSQVFIDEIQKVPDLLEELQYLYDQDPRRFEFFVTGSSARKLKGASANLLPGRSHVYHITPLMQSEFGSCRQSILPVTDDTQAEHFPPRDLHDQLLYGNLPGIVQEAEASRRMTLESYLETYLEEEIRAEAIVKNLGSFQEFIQLAALESGNTVNMTKLSQESNVPLGTIRNFYQVLKDTYVGYRIPAFGAGGRKRVLTTPKCLFFDLGVRNAAARVGFSEETITAQAGQLFENWVGLELINRCFALGHQYKLSFWRTVQQTEVDFVLESPDGVVPIEVKWTENPHERDVRHVEAFLKAYPDKATEGYLVCRCDRPFQITERVKVLPWSQM